MVCVDIQVWLGLCGYHTGNNGRVYVVYRSYYCMAVRWLSLCSPTFVLISYCVIRTQFRRQANSADNKAATVAVDSLLNYEAVKVCTRHFPHVRMTTITHVEFQQRAVRGRAVRYALARVRKGVGQDSNLSCAP